MATTKRGSTAARAAKGAGRKVDRDVGDKAAELVDELQDELEEAVEGAQSRMVAARERGERLVALVQAKKQQIARSFYDIGKALAELQRDKLYIALGKKSFAQLLADRQLLGLSQAKKLIAIAESFDRAEALALGTEKAYALVRLARTTPEDDTPRQLAAGRVRVAGKAKKTASMTATEIEQATHSLKVAAGSGRRVTAEERASVAAARRVQAALRRAGLRETIAEARRVAGEWKLIITIASAHATRLQDLVRAAR
jgi:hypothetical protein